MSDTGRSLGHYAMTVTETGDASVRLWTGNMHFDAAEVAFNEDLVDVLTCTRADGSIVMVSCDALTAVERRAY